MRANISVHEPRTSQDQDSALAFSMEGYSGSQEQRQQIPFAWAPGWNSPQAWNKFQDEVGGHLRAGDPGVRLIESKGTTLPWFAVPAAFEPTPGTWQAVPLYHLFGSEETSARAAPLQQRIPQAYVALGNVDAERLGLGEGASVALTIDGRLLRLPLRVCDELASGLIGLPVGLPGIPAVIAGALVTALQEVAP
jgi:NADH-quinone oxidoreductase subunit G